MSLRPIGAMRRPSKSAPQESLSNPARAPAKIAVLPQRPTPLDDEIVGRKCGRVQGSCEDYRNVRWWASRGHPHAEFKRALDRGNLWVAEAVTRDLPQVSLEDALRLAHLCVEKESPTSRA
jgi:hypothetical protein